MPPAMPYVDAFVIPVPRDRIEDYKALARKARALWMAHGALSFVECIADDVPHGERTSFPRAVQLADDEIVVVSWITYESRESRDACNAKVMADPSMQPGADMPFDGKRMIFGGFVPFLGL